LNDFGLVLVVVVLILVPPQIQCLKTLCSIWNWG